MSTLSNWLSGLPLSPEHEAVWRARGAAANSRRAATLRAARERHEALEHAKSAASIGSLTARELFLIGIALYWGEGEKNKPWRRGVTVRLGNTDPTVIGVWIAWLQLLGYTRDDLSFSLQIHASADAQLARSYWAAVVEVPLDNIQVSFKRHGLRPTNRRNVGQRYVGLLRVNLRRSAALNRQIEAWWSGIASSAIGGAVEADTVEAQSGVV